MSRGANGCISRSLMMQALTGETHDVWYVHMPCVCPECERIGRNRTSAERHRGNDVADGISPASPSPKNFTSKRKQEQLIKGNPLEEERPAHGTQHTTFTNAAKCPVPEHVPGTALLHPFTRLTWVISPQRIPTGTDTPCHATRTELRKKERRRNLVGNEPPSLVTSVNSRRSPSFPFPPLNTSIPFCFQSAYLEFLVLRARL